MANNNATNRYFQILNKFKEILVGPVQGQVLGANRQYPKPNTVSYGDIFKIDLKKQSIFPIAHIVINQVTLEEQLQRFNISLIVMDIVFKDKDNFANVENEFNINDNELYVKNKALLILNQTLQRFRYFDLYRDEMQLEGNPTLEEFNDRFENEVAGMVATFDIVMPNNINVC